MVQLAYDRRQELFLRHQKPGGYLIKNSLVRYKGNYYYVGKDGSMVTGWVTDKSGNRYYFGKDGKAVTGKHKIKGTNYYFNQNGALTHTGLNYNISSDCALLMNADTGKIVYAKMKMWHMQMPAPRRS